MFLRPPALLSLFIRSSHIFFSVQNLPTFLISVFQQFRRYPYHSPFSPYYNHPSFSCFHIFPLCSVSIFIYVANFLYLFRLLNISFNCCVLQNISCNFHQIMLYVDYESEVWYVLSSCSSVCLPLFLIFLIF